MKADAEKYLKQALNDSSASFRDGQWESIEPLLNGQRALVVQRTGWGKSMVYFLATKLLREKGAGPTLIISPLLSLIRNQIEAAERISIIARSINSTNSNESTQIKNELKANQVDILMISPERLANEDFRQNVLADMAGNIGLLVVDEAHCISDWGHDFRPDYRRIVRVLDALPSTMPVLATTATANNRVVDDVQSQLCEKIIVQRGTLVRKSLKLQNINMPSPAARMAWLARHIPNLPGSGIIYTLTQRDAEWVTKWLVKNSIAAKTYHADAQDREELEQQLINNEIKVLVATVALGMGFDKPDLGFVIHYQRPASVVHYYQQVGRAGRAVDEAYGILLCGEEDDRIADYFIRTAFPPQQHISEILTALDESDRGLMLSEIQGMLNLSQGNIEKTLKFLTVESPSPVTKIDRKWQITTAGNTYQIDQEHINAITNRRRQEQQQMQEYMQHGGCLMSFLQVALDDPSPLDCGKCKNCNPDLLLDETFDEDLVNAAGIFLRRNYQVIEPRKLWPSNNAFSHYSFSGTIARAGLEAEEGRALCLWRDSGWGQLVATGKYETDQFDDKLVAACIDMLQVWAPNPAPEWITCIPSLNHPNLVPNFAKKIADELKLPFLPCIDKTRHNQKQKEMQNSYQQAKNLDNAFKINMNIPNSPCLLVDDVVDSKWTFTVAAALLRQAGCSAVYPLALAMNTLKID